MKIINNKRIIQKRYGTNFIYDDPDITFSVNYNSSETIITAGCKFDRQLSFISMQWPSGDNKNILLNFENTDTLIKNIKSGEDGNGDFASGNYGIRSNCRIYLPYQEKSLVKKITTQGVFGNLFAGKIKFNNGWDSLIEIDASTNSSTTEYDISNLPSLKILKCKSWVSNPNGDFSSSLSLRFLKLIIVTDYPLSFLPKNLNYLYIIPYGRAFDCNLSDYFTGSRKALYMDSGRTLTYSGGAIFPSVLNEDVNGDFTIDWIMHQPSTVTNKLTGNDLSQFIIDFANQVTACNLINKRMRFQGSVPNTSYTDNTQPLFKTYASALNHIQNTLGITVTFT